MAVDTVKMMAFRHMWQLYAALSRVDSIDSMQYRRIWRAYASTPMTQDPSTFISNATKARDGTVKEWRTMLYTGY